MKSRVEGIEERIHKIAVSEGKFNKMENSFDQKMQKREQKVKREIQSERTVKLSKEKEEESKII